MGNSTIDKEEKVTRKPRRARLEEEGKSTSRRSQKNVENNKGRKNKKKKGSIVETIFAVLF